MKKEILDEVAEERARQEGKWGEQNHPDFNPQGILVATLPDVAWVREIYDAEEEDNQTNWTTILAEEFMEAVEEAQSGNTRTLREELIQVAAVAVAWVEALDRRAPGLLKLGEREGLDS